MRRRIGGNGFGANAGVARYRRDRQREWRRARGLQGIVFCQSATVDGEVNFSAEDFALFADGGAVARCAKDGALPLAVNVFRCGQRMVLLVCRTSAGEKSSVGGDHRRVFFFATKSAAGFHLHDAHALRGKREELHQGFVDVVGTLKRAPDSEALVPRS